MKASDPTPMPGTKPAARRRIHGALRNSFIDGVLSSFTGSAVESFAVAAILALGAGNQSVGTLAGSAGLLAALAQFLSPRITALAPSRRILVVRCARLQAAACFLFAAAGFIQSPFFLRHVFGLAHVPSPLPMLAVGLAIGAAVLAYTAYSVAGSIPRGAWASWMSDLVPRSSRGRYFSWRGVWLGGIYGATALAIGYTFRGIWGPGVTPPWIAFAALFSLAGLSRLAASEFVVRQYEPRAARVAPASDFTYWQFLSRTGRSNFATFTVCLALLSAGGSLTGPFFQLYFLRDLKDVPLEGLAAALASGVARLLGAAGIGSGEFRLAFDLSTYVLLPTISLTSRLAFIRFWGRVADRWGNLLVMRLCGLGLAFIPLLYVGTPRFSLMVLGWIFGGMVWGGLDLASFNYVMEAVTPARRVRCFAYMEGTAVVAVALFSFAAGPLVDRLPPLYGYQMQSLFVISAVLRFLPALGLVLFVREVRKTRPPFTITALFSELRRKES